MIVSAEETEGIIARIVALRREIADVARSVGRDPATIRLCAVTKGHSAAAVRAALQAGVEDIGESYAQEAHEKLADVPVVGRRHFIGHLQRNKIRGLVALFDTIQSVDRVEVGRAILQASRESGRSVSVLVQVTSSPTERFGVGVDRAPMLAEELRTMGLHVDGVMAIGPLTQDRGEIRRSFEEAARLFSHIGGTTLSIGMSGDWREAIAAGSTMLRIGTAIFGTRVKRSAAVE